MSFGLGGVQLDAVNVDFSSHHSDSYKNGSWSCDFNNLAGLKQSRKIFASKVAVPNIVPNVNIYNKSLSIVGVVAGTVDSAELPDGFYEGAPLASAIQAYLSSHFILSYEAGGKFKITTTGGVTGSGDTYFLRGTMDFFKLIGFDEQVTLEGGTNPDQWALFNLGSTSSVEFMGHSVGNLSGSTIFHILASDKAGNSMESANGATHDVLFTGMFDSRSPYGHYTTYEATDRKVDEINHKTPINWSSAKFSLVDHKMRPMPVPKNYPVFLICRVYHSDTFSV